MVSLSSIVTVIIAAINRGAPLYNAGDIAGCADLYMLTTVELLSTEFTGFPRDRLSEALTTATRMKTFDEQAWTLRQAFDSIIDYAESLSSTQVCNGQDTIGNEEIAEQISFQNPTECQLMRSMHDGVMGGVSSGGFSFDPVRNSAIFTGTVRTENNGGFASVRRSVSLDANGYDGIYIDASSTEPSRVFSFSVKDANCISMGGVNFKCRFSASMTDTRILLPFSTFKPEFRGRSVSVPPLQLARIAEISFMATKPAGVFSLSVSKLGFYKSRR